MMSSYDMQASKSAPDLHVIDVIVQLHRGIAACGSRHSKGDTAETLRERVQGPLRG